VKEETYQKKYSSSAKNKRWVVERENKFMMAQPIQETIYKI